MPKSTIVSLGRNGDVINLLPLAYWISQNGGCNWLIAEEYHSILDGVSYITPHSWHGSPETLEQAIQFANSSLQNPLISQVHKNPDRQRLMDSYCKESWRLSGYKYSTTWPLIFDKRDKLREKQLIDRYIDKSRKNILVGTQSISSPFKEANRLIAKIRGLNANVVDLDNIKAERIYDLIGLYDAADLIVSVDTVHIHLARACYTPLIAIINDGWCGSVTPPQTIKTYRYSDPEPSNILGCIKVTFIKQEVLEPMLVVDVHGKTERHKEARRTWPKYGGTIRTKTVDVPRFKDVLFWGINNINAMRETSGVVIWTNDDVGFFKNTVDKIKAHARKFPFGCSRRDTAHVGREIFWFRTDWLKAHIDEMPDVFIARPKFDLVIARWLRQKMGITTVEENLVEDFAPIEVPPGLIWHKEHESAWIDKDDEETKWNEKLWEQDN
ncbi:MAG: hypothetical protein DMF62_10495 [Acidobacteria bacterium]|nr:MAG: hypothetical protein DMF62_10495 [Acidobacteriota bacterium]